MSGCVGDNQNVNFMLTWQTYSLRDRRNRSLLQQASDEQSREAACPAEKQQLLL
jgi:hypothetical protein